MVTTLERRSILQRAYRTICIYYVWSQYFDWSNKKCIDFRLIKEYINIVDLVVWFIFNMQYHINENIEEYVRIVWYNTKISFKRKCHRIKAMSAYQPVSIPIGLSLTLLPPLSIPLLFIHTRHPKMLTISPTLSLVSIRDNSLHITFQLTIIILWLSLHLNQPWYSFLGIG
jgi:hypothetical protein